MTIGYSTWAAFRRERVDFSSSWLRDLVRLLRSPLDLVKEAVCTGTLPLRDAVQAPGRCKPENQEAWLARALRREIDLGPREGENELAGGEREGGRSPPRARYVRDCEEWRNRNSMDVVSGTEAETVEQARGLVRIVLGWKAPNPVADAHIIESWCEVRTAVDILNEAHAPRSKPGPTPPGWCAEEDPATAIAGPWVEPTDLDHALRLLEDLQALRRSRIATLALAVETMAYYALYFDLGFSSLADFGHDVLGVLGRTLQRYRKLGRTLELWPEIRAAVEGGLDLDRAQLVEKAGCQASITGWLAVARRVGVTELVSAVELRLSSNRNVLGQYEAEIERARDLLSWTPEPDATSVVGPADPDARSAGAPPYRVAFRETDPAFQEPRRPEYIYVHPNLPEAAAWYLATVKVPDYRGFQKVKPRDRFVCANPECRRRGLRCHAHHVVFASLGGSDDRAENGICVCTGCHLRLVHAGRVVVDRVGDRIVWTWKDRRVAVAWGWPDRP